MTDSFLAEGCPRPCRAAVNVNRCCGRVGSPFQYVGGHSHLQSHCRAPDVGLLPVCRMASAGMTLYVKKIFGNPIASQVQLPPPFVTPPAKKPRGIRNIKRAGPERGRTY